MKTPNEVHAFLMLKYGQGYVTKLAQKFDCSKSTISQTINGLQFNHDKREKIAADSGMTSAEMFEPEFDVFVGLKDAASMPQKFLKTA